MARFTTGTMARACSTHPWRTIIVWLLLFVVALALIFTLLGSATTTEFAFSNEPESLRGFNLIEERFGKGSEIGEVVIVTSDRYTFDDPEFQAFVMGLAGEIRALGGDIVKDVVTYYLIPPEMGVAQDLFVSSDRRTTIIQVTMAGDLEQALANIGELHQVTVDAEPEEGFEVLITGDATVSEDFNKTAEQTLQQAELFGIPIAMLVLVFIFVAIVAASIPLIIAGVAIVLAMALTAITGQIWDDMSFFVINMITMMGLAVGIDYALFTVSRYREERRLGREKYGAIVTSGATASNAVLFSGLTVILALLGLIIVPMSLFQSLAAGAIFVVSMAIMVTLTLLPAFLALIGYRIDSPRMPALRKAFLIVLGAGAVFAVFAFIFSAAAGMSLWVVGPGLLILFALLVVLTSIIAGWMKKRSSRKDSGGFWDQESRTVMKHPVISLVIGAGILGALAIPSLDIETGQGKVEDLPHDLTGVEGVLALKRDFPFAFTATIQAVVDGDIGSPEVQAAIGGFQQLLAGDPETFGPADIEVDEAGDLAIIEVPLPFDPASREATGIVERVRGEIVPEAFGDAGAEVLVTGDAAFNLDFYNTTDEYQAIVIIFVLSLSFLLLTIVFRSLVVPLKAIVMNLLSVFASYGLLVLVFQKGYGNEIFGFNHVDTIDAWIPLFLFAILFGLSMDYHVFLLSRIRERYLQTGDNTESVAFGIRSTGGIITGAALIMVVIFGGFASGSLVSFQQMGFGMGIAVLLDATIIRSIVVPASMRLLGDWNWYLPRWLGWLPELHVEGKSED